jgi:hypothetical protein
MKGVTISRDALRVLAESGDLAIKIAGKMNMPADGPAEFEMLLAAVREARAALEKAQDVHAPAGAESFAANTQPAGASFDSKACCCTTNDCPLPKVRRSGAEAQYGTFTCPPSCRAKEKVSHRGTEGTEI